MASAHDLAAFIRGCADGRAFVWDEAMRDARADFDLYSQGEVLKFIGGGGLENPTFREQRSLERNPSEVVDAYNFHAGAKYGYVAFYYARITNKWIIKSFKLNTDPDPRTLPTH